MTDGLSRLLPDDPKNLLSIEARKRIQRAQVAAEQYIWQGEHQIEKRKIDLCSEKAHSLRKEARFKTAQAVLLAEYKEFSRLNMPIQKFWQIMRDEIESAGNSFQLSDVERRLLENQFFYPEEQQKQRRPGAHLIALPKPKPDTIALQINRLREESRLTIEELAERVDMDVRSVERHIADKTVPYARHLRVYEHEFSKLLNRKVVINKMPERCR